MEVVTKLLRTLKIGKRALARMTITPNGVRVQTVSPSRVFNGQLFLETGLFATYACEGEMAVTLSVSSLVNCLQMFVEWSLDSGCFFEYIEGRKFQLSFSYESMTSVCDMTLLELSGTDDVAEIAFDTKDVILQVILSASTFFTALRDMEAIGAEEIEFAARRDLQIRARGELVSTDFVFANDPGVLDAFMVERAVKFRFSFEHVAKAMEAVRLAKKVSLRFDAQGTLSVQCLCEFGELHSYIEFRVLANA